MKKIEAWKTTNGKVFENVIKATTHQLELDTIEEFRKVVYRGMVETAEDVINFLTENKTVILKFYGTSEN